MNHVIVVAIIFIVFGYLVRRMINNTQERIRRFEEQAKAEHESFQKEIELLKAKLQGEGLS